MKVKICGLTKAEHVEECIKHGSDYCGFILNYPKSHRYIQFEKAKELISIEREKTKYVGVLVNPKKGELEKI